MSTLALISGAENLKAQIVALAENGEPHKAFLISHALWKISDDLKKSYQPNAIAYWQENKELPGGYSCKESNRSSYAYEQDPQWQLLKAHLDAREELLKASADTTIEFYDPLGEIVPKVQKKSSAVFSFSQKKW